MPDLADERLRKVKDEARYAKLGFVQIGTSVKAMPRSGPNHQTTLIQLEALETSLLLDRGD